MLVSYWDAQAKVELGHTTKERLQERAQERMKLHMKKVAAANKLKLLAMGKSPAPVLPPERKEAEDAGM